MFFKNKHGIQKRQLCARSAAPPPPLSRRYLLWPLASLQLAHDPPPGRLRPAPSRPQARTGRTCLRRNFC